MRITIEDDKQVDEDFLELVINDLWDMVKAARRARGPKQQSYLLSFTTARAVSEVVVTVEKRLHATPQEATP